MSDRFTLLVCRRSGALIEDCPSPGYACDEHEVEVVRVASRAEELALLLSLYRPNVPDGNFLGDAAARGGNAMLKRVIVTINLADEADVEEQFRRLDREQDERFDRFRAAQERKDDHHA